MKHFLIVLVFFVVLVFSFTLNAQITFERWYGGTGDDYGSSVAQTSDGGYIIAGYTESFGAGENDVYLIKTDSLGYVLWTKTYGGLLLDKAYSIQETVDSGYIITGVTMSFGAGSYDVWLLKTDANGDTLWAKTYGGMYGDGGEAVDITSDGGYIIIGWTNPTSGYNYNFYLIKTDEYGETLWTGSYGTPGSSAFSGQQTSDDGYIATGFTGGWEDILLVKTDSNGDTLWSRIYGGYDWEYMRSVKQTLDGGYILAGWTWSFGAGWEDVYIIRTDSIGDTLWTRVYGGTSYDEGYSVVPAAGGGYLVVGYTNSFSVGYSDVWILRLDANGDTIWTKTYGGMLSDQAREVQKTHDGGYVIVGYTGSFGAGGRDVYLIKTDVNGNVGIEEKKDQRHKTTDLRLLCYPNPFTTSTTISFTRKEQRAKGTGLRIYDESGRLIESIPLTSNQLSLGTELKPGIYFLKVDGVNVGKVVKVR